MIFYFSFLVVIKKKKPRLPPPSSQSFHVSTIVVNCHRLIPSLSNYQLSDVNFKYDYLIIYYFRSLNQNIVLVEISLKIIDILIE